MRSCISSGVRGVLSGRVSSISFEAFFDDSAGFGDRNIGKERFNIGTDHDVCIVYGLGEDTDEMLGVIDMVLRLSYKWLENRGQVFGCVIAR